MGEISPGLLMGGLVVFMAGAALMGGWAGKVAREEEEERGRRNPWGLGGWGEPKRPSSVPARLVPMFEDLAAKHKQALTEGDYSMADAHQQSAAQIFSGIPKEGADYLMATKRGRKALKELAI
jgi:hypothetical protein